MVPFVPIVCGLAVLVSWVTLLARRRWRADPSWVDRFGRALGVYWIVGGFLTCYWVVSEIVAGLVRRP